MKNRLLQNKLYLYMTEFFSGMAVMAVELGASRLLAPYFSSSQIVWTIIIGTIMIAMALGNLWGGRSADRNPDPDRLYRRLLISAVWIAMIPVAGKYIIVGITGLLVVTVSTNLLIWASFLACMVIFVFPLFLLGTVTPSLAKYSVTDLEDSGRIVGTLGAFNTIGSILGTFLPTFVTIPAAGTSITFLIFSGILLLIALVYFLFGGRRRTKTALLCLVLFLLAAVFGNSDSFAFWEKDLTYEGESVYNYLQVRDTETSTILSTNVLVGVQSVYRKDQNLTGLYYDTALLAPVMAGDPGAGEKASSILILGMGTGTYAQQCVRYFPDCRVKGVEIDERITELARRYFALPEEIPVLTYDGRAFLNVDTELYDVIMVDAYQDITIPFQMSSAEFFTLVKERLKPGGVMVVNMNMHSEASDGINAWLSDTIASVFPCVCTADVPGTTNRELFASAEDVMTALPARIEDVPDEELRSCLMAAAERLSPYAGQGRIFTDDQAPVEMLGIRVLDELIQGELKYYKDVFQREGFAGLIKEI